MRASARHSFEMTTDTTSATFRVALLKSEPEVTPARWIVIEGIRMSPLLSQLLHLLHWQLDSHGARVLAHGISTYVWHVYSKSNRGTFEVGEPRLGTWLVHATPEEDARKAVDVWRHAVHEIKRRQMLTEPQIHKLDKRMATVTPVETVAATTATLEHGVEETLMRIASKAMFKECDESGRRVFAEALACGYRQASSDNQAKLLKMLQEVIESRL